MLRRVVLPVVLVALAAAACGGGEEPAAVEDTAPAVEVPPFEVVKDEGRVTELLSEGVDADGARAVIDAWVRTRTAGRGSRAVRLSRCRMRAWWCAAPSGWRTRRRLRCSRGAGSHPGTARGRWWRWTARNRWHEGGPAPGGVGAFPV